jgi:hypothetical protein
MKISIPYAELKPTIPVILLIKLPWLVSNATDQLSGFSKHGSIHISKEGSLEDSE